MIKKIAVGDLKPGMYVHDLDCGWLEHPFFRSRFLIQDQKQIGRILAAGINHVTIDTELGCDLPDPDPVAAPQAIETDPELKPPDTIPASGIPVVKTVEEEFRDARRVHSDANRVIRGLLNDVRLGRQISREQVEPVVERMAESILRNPGPLLALCRLKSKDEYTFMHSVSVSALLMMFCRAAGRERAVCEAGIGGLLHDVGKMRTPERVLNKPGRLSEEELVVMRNHVTAGIAIVRQMPGITAPALDVVAQHHERFDGSGYPAGLEAGAISPIGQMAAIVDVYDAITSDRVYRKGVSPPEAIKNIIEWSRSQFDRDLVRIFVAAIGIYPVGTLVRLESGRLAVVVDHAAGKPLMPRVRVVYDSVKNAYVEPYDVDLARSEGHGGADRILKHEPPSRWSFNPLSYLR
jgi:putative nucleotidyltransferase with HDIG domain